MLGRVLAVSLPDAQGGGELLFLTQSFQTEVLKSSFHNYGFWTGKKIAYFLMMTTPAVTDNFPQVHPLKPHIEDNSDHRTARKKMENLKIEGGSMS